MQKHIESRNLEILDATDDVIECREIIVNRITIDKNEFARKQEELELAQFAKKQAEQKIEDITNEIDYFSKIYTQVKEQVQSQTEFDEQSNG